MGLCELAAMSNRYGSDSRYVLAGGGNTSFKDEKHLYIKGSGTALATIRPEEFVVMERAGVSAIMSASYPESDKEREAAALSDLMDARVRGETRRPSVETPLHNLFPFAYVLHTHPTLVNGLTCGKDAEALTAELFPEAVWVPLTKPGYVLAVACNKALAAYKAAHGKDAQVLILQNHGIFVAADTVKEIDAIMADVMAKLEARVTEQPDLTDAAYDRALVASIAPAIRMVWGDGVPASVTFFANNLVLSLVKDRASFSAIAEPCSPDHIVYCKAHPLFVESTEAEDIAAAMKEYRDVNGYMPKIVAVQGLGMFAVGKNRKDALTAKALILDMAKISVYAKFFGGVNALPAWFTDFIVNWETESYRSSLIKSDAKRMADKVCLVTGAAQGFGKGIAESLAAEGAYVVIADLNGPGAEACAEELSRKYGEGRFLAITADVTKEESIESMFLETAATFGGLDLYVNNAGVAFAGALEEMPLGKFTLLTSINYTAYFLCTKYASRIMKQQHKFAPDYWADIIEINSKSGLVGSKNNFAYAGSKFGGIGLTQSFALELVGYGIKVNAVCPGNFLDGPLWSDPVKGLFVQYLNAGKVPGAKTVADVRKYYMDKVPMGRGCQTEDVARAILYIVEQKYETGQAVPVTGGQSMLK